MLDLVCMNHTFEDCLDIELRMRSGQSPSGRPNTRHNWTQQQSLIISRRRSDLFDVSKSVQTIYTYRNTLVVFIITWSSWAADHTQSHCAWRVWLQALHQISDCVFFCRSDYSSLLVGFCRAQWAVIICLSVEDCSSRVLFTTTNTCNGLIAG